MAMMVSASFFKQKNPSARRCSALHRAHVSASVRMTASGGEEGGEGGGKEGAGGSATGRRSGGQAAESEAEAEEEEALVVVELPPEARLVAGDELVFHGLGTPHPRLQLPSGAELMGCYEESVGHLLLMQPPVDQVSARGRRGAGGRCKSGLSPLALLKEKSSGFGV